MLILKMGGISRICIVSTMPKIWFRLAERKKLEPSPMTIVVLAMSYIVFIASTTLDSDESFAI